MPVDANDDLSIDPQHTTWVPDADGTEFPIQNLPMGSFTTGSVSEWQIGWRIGDWVLAARPLIAAGWFDHEPELAAALKADRLNAYMHLSAQLRRQGRRLVSESLKTEAARLRNDADLRAAALLPLKEVECGLPASIGDYTDFYASRDHAWNVGSMFRPDSPLLPNYDWVPIAYHGRSSSIVTSGKRIRRPRGQILGAHGRPEFKLSDSVDYEQELAIWIAGENELSCADDVDVCDDERFFGVGLLNDWSARDIQKWEYQPLGPFLGKNFATSVSPWVVTSEALIPFRCQHESPSPQVPLRHLQSRQRRPHGIDLTLETYLSTEKMRGGGLPPQRLSRSNTRRLMWSPAQMIAHHVSNGCNLRPGDLLGSGTVSGPDPSQRGCLLELTWAKGQRVPLALTSGENRHFLEKGDEVIMRGFADRPGAVRIGLGECRGRIED